MFCPSCGNQVPDQSVVCPACGNDLTAAHQVTAQPPTSAPVPQPTAPTPMPTQPMPQAPAAYAPPPAGAYPPGYPPAGAPGVPPVAPRKSNAGLIVAIVIGGVILAIVAIAAGGFYAYTTGSKGKVAKVVTTVATGTPSSSASASAMKSAMGARSAQAAVDAWYAAVAKGNLDAIRKTATSSFAAAIDASTFEGRDPNMSYRVVGTTVDGDTAKIDVQEMPTNAPAQTAVTFTVEKQSDGTWLVGGYEATALAGSTGSSTTGSATGEASTPSFTKADAIDVVGRFLNDIKSGDGKVAKSLATDRFQKANPGWIFGPTSEYEFEVVGAKQNGDEWKVTVKERWQSGPETAVYTVEVLYGKGFVDRRSGLN